MPHAPQQYRPAGYQQQKQQAAQSIYNRPGAEWLHSQRWRKARVRFLYQHSLCVTCERAGHTTAANHVDHIKAHKGDYERFWDEANWQALCASCHSRKTASEDHGFGNSGQGGGSRL